MFVLHLIKGLIQPCRPCLDCVLVQHVKMMRALVARVGSQQRELPSCAVSSVRYYLTPQAITFTEDVAIAKPAIKDGGTPVLASWKSQAAATAQLMQLLQAYKDLGDAKQEPYLKYHNPRTFEDLSKEVPNFRALSLKAGEVPRFFDNVLSGRASDAVSKKNAWWETRRKEALEAAKTKTGQVIPAVPVPTWVHGQAVSLDNLKSVTDKYVKSLEPKRKLQLAPLPAQVKDSISGEATELVLKALADKAVVVEGGKALPGFKYVSKAVAAKVLAARRAEVHDRYVKYWAKKVLVSPELAAVPLKKVDAQLASKFEHVAPEYAEVLSAAGAGSKTLAGRLVDSPAFSRFFLKRETEQDVAAELPPSEAEAQGASLAAQLSDPAVALKQLLGPELQPLGAAGTPLSAQVRAITEHKYTSDRYLYKEGMALAARLEAEEAAGGDPLNPPTPVQQVVSRLKELEGSAAKFAAEKAGADSAYTAYALAKKQEFLSDASNVYIEELQLPELVTELLDLELAELAEQEAAIEDAEEEELWALTLTAQLKHLQKHFGVDLPHGVIAHMDPILIKKIDWETTNNLEDWDITLEDLGSEYAKEQWGLESLSHHLLPLVRYRRAKARAQGGNYAPELAAPIR